MRTPVPPTTVDQTFCVVGMSCHHCEMAVAAELSKVAGVIRVGADATTGTVTTESTAALAVEAVAAAIDEAGYELA
jgi:copper chaperone